MGKDYKGKNCGLQQVEIKNLIFLRICEVFNYIDSEKTELLSCNFFANKYIDFWHDTSIKPLNFNCLSSPNLN